jgi:hypothetical protein
MMSKSGNSTHDATIVSAESTRQSAVSAAGTTQAQANTATIAFYRSAVSSAVANGLDAGPFIFALKTLGATV